MSNLLLILQLIAAILLVFFILIQVKGKGFGKMYGSDSSFTRRGLEILVFKATFVVAFLFIVISLASFIIS